MAEPRSLWGFLRGANLSSGPKLEITAEFSSLKSDMKAHKAGIAELEKECDIYKRAAAEHSAATKRFHSFFRRFTARFGLNAAGPSAFLEKSSAAQSELNQLAEDGIALAADALAVSASTKMAVELERVRSLKNAVYSCMQASTRGGQAIVDGDTSIRFSALHDECVEAMRGLEVLLRSAVVGAVMTAAAAQAAAMRAAAVRLDNLVDAGAAERVTNSAAVPCSATAPPTRPASTTTQSASTTVHARSPFRGGLGTDETSLTESVESPLRANKTSSGPRVKSPAPPYSRPSVDASTSNMSNTASPTSTTKDLPLQVQPSFSMLVGETLVECCEGVGAEVGPTAGSSKVSTGAVCVGVFVATNYRLRWFPTALSQSHLPHSSNDSELVSGGRNSSADRISFNEGNADWSETSAITQGQRTRTQFRLQTDIMFRRRFNSSFDLPESLLHDVESPGPRERRVSKSFSVFSPDPIPFVASRVPTRSERIAAMVSASRPMSASIADISSIVGIDDAPKPFFPPARPRALSEASTASTASRSRADSRAVDMATAVSVAHDAAHVGDHITRFPLPPPSKPAEYLSVPLLSIARMQSLAGPSGCRVLLVQCSDARRVAFKFPRSSSGTDKQHRVTRLVSTLAEHTWVSAPSFPLVHKLSSSDVGVDGWSLFSFDSELARLCAQGPPALSNHWRVCSINHHFRLSPTYPERLIIPSSVSDVIASASARFRSKR